MNGLSDPRVPSAQRHSYSSVGLFPVVVGDGEDVCLAANCECWCRRRSLLQQSADWNRQNLHVRRADADARGLR